MAGKEFQYKQESSILENEQENRLAQEEAFQLEEEKIKTGSLIDFTETKIPQLHTIKNREQQPDNIKHKMGGRTSQQGIMATKKAYKFTFKNNNEKTINSTPTPEQRHLIFKKLAPIIQKLVRLSKPKGKELFNDNINYPHDVIIEWKENIFNNFNKLLTKENHDFILDSETKSSALKSEIEKVKKIAQLSYKIDKKRSEDRKGKKDAKTKRNEIYEKWDKYEEQETLKFNTDDSNSTEMIGLITREEYEENLIEEEWIEKEIKRLEKKLSNERSGFANFFVSAYKWLSKVIQPSTRKESDRYLDPEVLFTINDGNEKVPYFIHPLNSIDDLTALVTPRARDSIIDRSDIFDEEDSKVTDDNLKIIQDLNDIDEYNIDEEDWEDLDEKHQNIIQKTKYETISEEDLKKVENKKEEDGNFDELIQYWWDSYLSANDKAKIMIDISDLEFKDIQNKLTKQYKDEVFDTWQTDQDTERVNNLKEHYSRLYFLFEDEGDWMIKKFHKTTDEEYDVAGNATQQTMKKFHDWITAKGKNPDDISEVKPKMTGWEIDNVKLGVLVEMSKNIIHEQKWAITPESTAYSKEHEKAGNEKTSYIDDQLDNSEDKMVGFAKTGKYNEVAQKRYPSYGPNGGYIPPTSNESTLPINEEIIWMINYSVELINPKKEE